MHLRAVLRRAGETPGRWLVWCAMGFALSALVSACLLPWDWLRPCALICAVLTLPCLALRGHLRTRAVLLCLFAALGFVRYAGYLNVHVLPAETLTGGTRTVQARVTDFPTDHGDYRSVPLRITGLTDTVLVYDYDGHLPDVRPGDEIDAQVRLISAASAGGERTNTYLSRGVVLRGYFTGGVTVTGTSGWLRYAPQYAAHALQSTCDAVFPERTAMFLKALITGEKGAVYQDAAVYADLAEAGLLHVIAVSGMHVSFLVAVVTMLTGVGMGLGLSLGIIGFFMVMTGLSPSVVRAGLMAGLYLLAPALRREADGPAALAGALLVLLGWNPCSIASAGLQLSFSGMVGLLWLTPRLAQWLRAAFHRLPWFPGRIAGTITATVSASVGATVFSLPLATLWFGYVPLYGVLTNLLCFWLIPVCFIGGFLACVLAMAVPAVTGVVGTALSIPVEAILHIAGWVADLPYAAVYFSGNHLAWWLAGSYLLLGGTWLCRGKRPWHPFYPVCISISTLCLLLMGTRGYYDRTTELAAVDVGQGQSIVLLREGTTVVVDCGGDSSYAGDETAAFLLGRQRSRVDLLVLTHLHADHVNGVERLMARVDVDRLLLPADAADKDGYLSGILSAAKRQGTEILWVEDTRDVTVGSIALNLFLPPYAGENQGIILRAELGDASALITGDCTERAEQWLVRTHPLPPGDILVAGHHGAGDSTGRLLVEQYAPRQAVISVGFNPYGHPAQETLDRLSAENVVVYRTDTTGDVELRIEDYGEEGNT